MGKRKSSLFLKHFIPSKGVFQPFIPVLDENIHTPPAVLGRCPFLFTVGMSVSRPDHTFIHSSPFFDTQCVRWPLGITMRNQTCTYWQCTLPRHPLQTPSLMDGRQLRCVKLIFSLGVIRHLHENGKKIAIGFSPVLDSVLGSNSISTDRLRVRQSRNVKNVNT